MLTAKLGALMAEKITSTESFSSPPAKMRTCAKRPMRRTSAGMLASQPTCLDRCLHAPCYSRQMEHRSQPQADPASEKRCRNPNPGRHTARSQRRKVGPDVASPRKPRAVAHQQTACFDPQSTQPAEIVGPSARNIGLRYARSEKRPCPVISWISPLACIRSSCRPRHARLHR